MFLRAGYNYGENPVKEHSSFDSTGTTVVQGVPFPNPAYESFRIIGFPAIVEHHLTLGIGYEVSDQFSFHLGYVHAFEETIRETDSSGGLAYESTLSEDSFDFGLTWRF